MPLFAAQPKIIARLEDGLADAVVVKPAETVKGIVEGKQTDKTLYLMLHRYRPAQDDHGASRLWDEQWMTVLALKSVGAGNRSARVAEMAGPILDQVLALLDGWSCKPEIVSTISVLSAPDPLITDGYSYFPLLFTWRSQTEQAEPPAY